MCSSELPLVDNPCGPLPGCNVIRQGRAKGLVRLTNAISFAAMDDAS